MATINKEYSFMEFPLSISRQSSFPLDRYSVFYTLSEAQAYASTSPLSYPGQIIAVVDKGVDEGEGTVSFYGILIDGSLGEIGGKVSVDNVTIATNESGQLEIKGFSSATPGQQLRIATGGGLEWFTPSSITVEGLSSRLDTAEGEIDQLQTDVANKVDKVEGKVLSTNDFTNELKTKLEGIAAGAEVNVQADWNETNDSSDAYIKNKPTSLPADGGNADTVGGKSVNDTQESDQYLWTAAKTKAYADGLLAANDAMVFKGIVNSTTPLPTTDYLVGWTYKVAEAGTYADQSCEIGDMIICVTDWVNGTASNADWQVVQSNLDGAVTSSATSSVDGTIAVFDGTSGKVIKVGSKTIADLEYTLPSATATTLGGVKITNVVSESDSSAISADRKLRIFNDSVIAIDEKIISEDDAVILNCGGASTSIS